MLFSVHKGVRHNCGFLWKNACFAGLNQRFTLHKIRDTNLKYEIQKFWRELCGVLSTTVWEIQLHFERQQHESSVYSYRKILPLDSPCCSTNDANLQNSFPYPCSSLQRRSHKKPNGQITLHIIFSTWVAIWHIEERSEIRDMKFVDGNCEVVHRQLNGPSEVSFNGN